MLLDNLCTPTVVFVVFAIAHLSLEMYDNQYSLALLKAVLAIVMVCLLEIYFGLFNYGGKFFANHSISLPFYLKIR